MNIKNTLFVVFMLAVIAGFIGLGVWQVVRLEWKRDLIVRAGANTQLKPVSLPASPSVWSRQWIENNVYRPFIVRGKLVYDAEVKVYTTLIKHKGVFNGRGYWVITPLMLTNNSVIMVNRGFIPLSEGLHDAGMAASEATDRPTDQQVVISGLLVKPERKNWFTLANNPAKNEWFNKDPLAIAAAFGLDQAKVAPFIIDADARTSPDLPQGGETVLHFVNNHLGYAITWFSLALVSSFLLIYWVFTNINPGRDRDCKVQE